MLGWIIITVIALLVTVGLFILPGTIDYIWETKQWKESEQKNDQYRYRYTKPEWQMNDGVGWMMTGWIMIVVTILFITVIITTPFSVRKQIYTFNAQKAYIESHVSKSALEDATITNKKIDMNDWLYRTQISQQMYGDFSFYPVSVQDLTPIQ